MCFTLGHFYVFSLLSFLLDSSFTFLSFSEWAPGSSSLPGEYKLAKLASNGFTFSETNVLQGDQERNLKMCLISTFFKYSFYSLKIAEFGWFVCAIDLLG